MKVKPTRFLSQLCLIVMLTLITGALKAQVTIVKEDFEDADFTGYSTAENKFFINGADYFERGTNGAPFAFSQNVTGFGGSNFIGLEDLDGALFTVDPHWLALDAQDISGYSNMSISIKFAAPNTIPMRYEIEDFFTVEYSIDGGAFQKVLDFKGGHNASGAPTGSGDRMRRDDDLDGTYSVEVSGGAMQTFTANLDNIKGSPVTGSSMIIRVRFSSEGSHEEMAFDDIELKGTYSASSVSASITSQTNVDCNGNSTGSLTVTASDGTPNFDYLWSNGSSTSNSSSTTNSISGLSAGTYTVTVTDDNGTTATASSTVTQPTVLSAGSGSVGNVTCNGGSDGWIAGYGTGGTNPYTYSWNNGGTDYYVTGVSAGTYTLTVTDANGCTATTSRTITEPTALALSSATTATSIDLTVGGGASPYTYSWSNGATNQDISSLSSGTYTVTVTDNNGCTASLSATAMASELVCYNGLPDTLESSSAPSGGSGNFVYQWQTSADGATGWTAAPGKNDSSIYIPSVGVTDTIYFRRQVTDTSCSATAYSNVKAIFVLDSISISGTPVAATCGASDGSLNTTVSGGQAPYTYAWSNSATTQNISSVAAGTYTITVTDNLGCVNSKTFIVPGASSVVAGAVVDSNVTCNGLSDGGATASVSGGATPYTYLWSNAATTASITGVAAGTYTVTISDNNGCTSTASASITEPTTLVASSVVDSNVSCNGGFDGGATASATGGTFPYSYAWSNSATTASITGVAAGTYSVIITDNNGCTASSSVTITEPATLVASTVVDSNVTCNGLYDGGATASVTGGTAPYMYMWSNAATTASITGVSAGTYTVTITDNKGCSDTSMVTVTEPATLVASTLVDSNVTCNGQYDGGATASATGGTAPYTYMWSNSATTASINGVSAGTYTVTITDNKGCSDTSMVTITEPATLVASAVVDSNASCNGLSDGGATAVVTGGTAPYSYLWSNSATTASITGVGAGTHTVVITDNNGCTSSSSASITQPTAFTITATADSLTNCEGTAWGEASVVANGGTTPYSYLWSNAETGSSIVNLAEGTYWVAVTDGCGTILHDTVEVTRPASPLVNITDTILCGTGGPLSLIASGGSDYLWYAADSTTLVNTGSTFNPIISSDTTFLVYITEGGEVDATSATATEVDHNSLTGDDRGGIAITQDYVYFNGDSYCARYDAGTLANGISLPRRDGIFSDLSTGDLYSLWSTATGEPVGTSISSIAIDAIAVMDSALNIGMKIGLSQSIIMGVNNTGDRPGIFSGNGYMIVYTGGQGNNWYKIDLPSGNVQLINTFTFTDKQSNENWAVWGFSKITNGQYHVVYRGLYVDQDINGLNLSSESIYTLGHFSNLSDMASITYSPWEDQVYFHHEYNSQFGPGSEMGGYFDASWIGGSTQASLSCPTEVKIQLSDLTASVVVDSNETCTDATNGGLTASPVGGEAPYTYSWSNGATTASVQGVTAGTYTVTITDAKGCSSMASQSIIMADTIAPAIQLPIASTDTVDIYLSPSGIVSLVAPTSMFVSGGIVSDDCGVDTAYYGIDTITCANIGYLPVTIHAKDINSNSSSFTFHTMVIDTIKPTVVSQDITVYLDATGNTSILASYLDNGTSDACGIDSLHLSKYDFDCSNVGDVTVQLYATDVNGNTAMANATVTVIDSTKPVLATRNVTAYLDATGNTSINATFIDNGTADECGLDTLLLSKYDFDCSNVGANTITFTAKDVNNNSISTTATVNVVDTISPVAAAQNISVYLDETGNGTITAADVDNGSADACGLDTLVISQYNFDCSHVGANNVTLTATDVNSNSSSETIIVTVIDTIKPVVLTQNTTIYLNGAGQASIVDGDINNGSTDACGIASTSLSEYNFDCSNTGANTVYLSVTDVNGNVDSASATVTVLDTISPVAKVHSITAYLDASGTVVVSPADVDNGSSDNCGFTLSLSQTTFDCTETGLNLKTFTITDASGNKDSKDAWITIKDTISPELHLYQSLTVSLDQFGSATIAPTQMDSASTDNCSNLLFFTASKTTFNCSNLGPNTITVTAYDNKNNSTTGTAIVTVKDYQAPVVVTQNITAYLDGSGSVTVLPIDVNNGTTDNCTVDSLWLDKDNFSCANLGQNIVKLYAKDQSGNSAQANAVITVLDTISPVVAAQNITIYLDANGAASIATADINNGSADNCAIQSLSLSKTAFDCSNVGANTVTLTATDASANSKIATATVTVMDTISPMVAVQNITVSLDANGAATITAADVNNGSSDACGIQSMSVDVTTFDCTDLGANTITLTVLDNNGNSTTATATVTVVDNTAPIVATQNITIYLDANGAAAITTTDVDNGSTDNCSIQSMSLDVVAFDCSDLGSNVVTLTATDGSSNTSSATAIVTVMDTISPMVAAQNITIYLDANGAASITTADINSGSADNCAIQSLSLSKTSFDCSNVGANTVTLTATDASANSKTATATVTVMDTISPMVATQNITVSLDANGAATITAADVNNGSSDACGIQSMSVDVTTFDCTDLGANAVTLTVLDNNGNSTTATATVTVEDNTAPTVITQDITEYLDANGAATITVSDIDNGSFDNCGIQLSNLDVTAFDCSDLGSNVVTLSATDGSSNTSSETAIVTVMDTISPMVAAQNITIYLDANGAASITTADINNGSADNCAIQSLSLSKTAFDCSNVGANTVTLTATDASANSKTATATVTVMDTISPMVATQNITVSLDANGAATITAADIDNGSSDACGIQSMSVDVTTFDCTDLGANTVTLTVLDNNGNSTTATATVTVVDNTAPIVATQNITIYLDANGDASIVPADVDNNSSDNCGITNYSLDISVFDCADLGQNLVMLTATDASNNSSTKSAFVTVLDTIDPTIDNLPTTITAYAPANQCAANVQWPNITGSDNCGVSLVNVSKANGGLFSLGTTTVNVSVADASGNTVNQSFNVVVVDTVSPTVSNVPNNYTVVPNANSCDAIVNWIEPVAIDNCGGVTWTKSHIPGSVFQVGTTPVTYTATDSDNNSTTVSFVVVVTDQLAPTISNVPANITVSSDAGSCDAVVNFTAPTVNDNCTGATLNASHTSGSAFPIGTTTVVFTAVDGANNTTTASFTITVEDNQKPVISSMPANDTVGACGSTYTYAMPVATDNCSAVSITQTSGLPSGSIFPAGVTVNTFRISDANGNDTVVSFAVVVVPQGMPNLPNVLEVCANMPAVELTLGQNIVWSGNGIVGGTQFNPAAAGAGRHQLSYTYTDNMGCTVSGSIYVTVLPVPVKPVISRIGSTTLSTDNYNSYQWYRNGVAIPGATGKTYSYTIGGNYQVMVANSSGCESYSDGMVIGTSGGGIGLEENHLSQLEMYPNPADDLLTFDLKGFDHREMEVVIFNTAGKKVFEVKDQTSAEGKLTIDLGHLPDATYIVRIQAGDESAVKRVVIY